MSSPLPKPTAAGHVRLDAVEVFEKHGYTRNEAVAFLRDRTVTGEIPGGVVIVNGERKFKTGACPKIRSVTPEGAAFISEQLKIAIRDRRKKQAKTAAAKKPARPLRPRTTVATPAPLPHGVPVTATNDVSLEKFLGGRGLGTASGGTKMFDTLAARAWNKRFGATKNYDARAKLHVWTAHDRAFLEWFINGQ